MKHKCFFLILSTFFAELQKAQLKESDDGQTFCNSQVDKNISTTNNDDDEDSDRSSDGEDIEEELANESDTESLYSEREDSDAETENEEDEEDGQKSWYVVDKLFCMTDARYRFSLIIEW